MTRETEPASDPTPPVSCAHIRQIIAGIDTRIDFRRLRDDTLFKDAGADSLDLFNLILAVEDEYHIRVPSEDLNRVNSLAGMAKYLSERIS